MRLSFRNLDRRYILNRKRCKKCFTLIDEKLIIQNSSYNDRRDNFRYIKLGLGIQNTSILKVENDKEPCTEPVILLDSSISSKDNDIFSLLIGWKCQCGYLFEKSKKTRFRYSK